VTDEQLYFLYTVAATILMGIAWLWSGGPWTQGDFFIFVGVLLAEYIAGWNRPRRKGPHDE
jgi:hypothetical protein